MLFVDTQFVMDTTDRVVVQASSVILSHHPESSAAQLASGLCPMLPWHRVCYTLQLQEVAAQGLNLGELLVPCVNGTSQRFLMRLVHVVRKR